MKLAVFDLDYTVWQPEMYQLYSEPKLIPIESLPKRHKIPSILKEATTNKEGFVLWDGSKTPMQVFQGAAHALREINQLKADGYDIQCAVASRTDVPRYAATCMDHLVIDEMGTTLRSCFDYIEISFANKAHHFRNLHQKTGIPYEDMCFFDNESGNIRTVSKLGVKCVYTPDGMTRADWQKGKQMFNM